MSGKILHTDRIEYIDVFRALGIILMVMGHVGFGKSFDYFIHAFHMPMFFFISGFVTKNRDIPFRDFLIKKSKSLLIPYFAFGILFIFVDLIWNKFDPVCVKNLFWISTNKLAIAEALWFLTALFFTDIIYFWINKFKDENIKWIVVIFITLIGCDFKSMFKFALPYAIGPAFVGVGLFHVGRCIKKYESFLTETIKIWHLLILLPILSYLIFKNGYINMRSELYANRSLFLILAIGFSVLGISMSNYIHKFLKNNLISKWLCEVGRDSIVYVCFNQFAILLLNKYLPNIAIFSNLRNFWILVFSFVIMYLINLILINTKLKFLIGRF